MPSGSTCEGTAVMEVLSGQRDVDVKRCPWAERSQIERDYHDWQWGVPVYDERMLFKMLILEGMQAGLSWLTVLRKMETLCRAFDDFAPELLADYGAEKEAELLQNEGIIRNRLKIKAASTNARAYLKLREDCGSFSDYLWGFVDRRPIVNAWQSSAEVPAKTELSDRISRDLKRRGFTFVGSTIVYAFMQAVGMVNDHLVDCDFRGV